MCIYIYMYIICIHICVYICVYIYTYIYIYIYTHTHIHAVFFKGTCVLPFSLFPNRSILHRPFPFPFVLLFLHLNNQQCAAWEHSGDDRLLRGAQHIRPRWVGSIPRAGERRSTLHARGLLRGGAANSTYMCLTQAQPCVYVCLVSHWLAYCTLHTAHCAWLKTAGVCWTWPTYSGHKAPQPG